MVEKLCWRTDVVSRRPRDCQRYVAERERGADCFSQWSKRVVLDGGCHDGNPLRVTVCEQYHPHLSATAGGSVAAHGFNPVQLHNTAHPVFTAVFPDFVQVAMNPTVTVYASAQ